MPEDDPPDCGAAAGLLPSFPLLCCSSDATMVSGDTFVCVLAVESVALGLPAFSAGLFASLKNASKSPFIRYPAGCSGTMHAYYQFAGRLAWKEPRKPAHLVMKRADSVTVSTTSRAGAIQRHFSHRGQHEWSSIHIVVQYYADQVLNSIRTFKAVCSTCRLCGSARPRHVKRKPAAVHGG